MLKWSLSAVLVAISLGTVATAMADDPGGPSLQEQAQNPIASLISVPIQFDVNFNVGDLDRTQLITNVQPVYPATLSDDWNLIIRPIVPIVRNPSLFEGDDSTFGLGDINPQFFFTPSDSVDTIFGTMTWGVGPSFFLPTATDDELGTGKWSVAPGAVVFISNAPWTYGFLAQNYWSFAGDDDRDEVRQFVFQPFVNHNLSDGWSLVTAPTIIANWEADDRRWTVPLGGGIQKLLKIGNQPVNATVRSYYNVLSPVSGPDWQIEAQITFLFPK
ncbi:MAG: neuromedin U [Pseudomonadota bacterium]